MCCVTWLLVCTCLSCVLSHILFVFGWLCFSNECLHQPCRFPAHHDSVTSLYRLDISWFSWAPWRHQMATPSTQRGLTRARTRSPSSRMMQVCLSVSQVFRVSGSDLICNINQDWGLPLPEVLLLKLNLKCNYTAVANKILDVMKCVHVVEQSTLKLTDFMRVISLFWWN